MAFMQGAQGLGLTNTPHTCKCFHLYTAIHLYGFVPIQLNVY